MYSDKSALLAAIRARPDDDTPRLVFADWCDDNNMPDIGAFIRNQVDAARIPAHFNALVTAYQNFLKPVKRPDNADEYRKHVENELERYGIAPEQWGEWVEEVRPYNSHYTNYPDMTRLRMDWLLDAVFELPRTIPATNSHPEIDLRGEWQGDGRNQYALLSGFERGLPVVRYVLQETLAVGDFKPEVHIPEPYRNLYGVRGYYDESVIHLGMSLRDHTIPEGLEIPTLLITGAGEQSAVRIGNAHKGHIQVMPGSSLGELKFEGAHTGRLSLYDSSIGKLVLAEGRVGDIALVNTTIDNPEGFVAPGRCHGNLTLNFNHLQRRVELPEDVGQTVSVQVQPAPRGLFSWLRRTKPPETEILLGGEPASRDQIMKGLREGRFPHVDWFYMQRGTELEQCSIKDVHDNRQVYLDGLARSARAEQTGRETRWQAEVRAGKWSGIDGPAL